MNLSQRVKAARKHAGLTQRELAKAARVEQPLISQLETGKTLKSAHIAQIAKACRVSAIWLASGEGEMVPPLRNADGSINLDKPWENLPEPSNVAPASQDERPMRSYPVISDVVAGDWAESCDNHQPGDADEWIESDKRAGECGYWLNVNGDSMLPNFPHGSRILVQPEGFDLVSGKFYVALIYEPGHRRETTFKQYVRDSGIEYLRPLNNDFRTLEITPSVRIIGRVIDFRPPRGLL